MIGDWLSLDFPNVFKLYRKANFRQVFNMKGTEKNKYDDTSVPELERLVRHHNQLYFVEKSPVISDPEFDFLVETLRRKKPDSYVLAQIGSDLTDASQKVRHETQMLSLDKAYDIGSMHNWAAKFEGDVIASPKIDGCAVCIRYDSEGSLSLSATRGNGVEGELITKNILAVKDVPKKISLKNVEIRGEIYMPLSIFKRYSSEFANPRNLAAGAIKQKDPKKTADYNLSFWGYDILGVDAETEEEKRQLLKKNHFPAIDWKLIKKDAMQKVFDEYLSKRNKFDFETDGVVYKVNSLAEQERLGITAHHPRFAIAYKFQGDSGETHIIDVEWSVSRTGVITPVGVVEPVILSGASVTRASLHNYGLMKKLGLTKGAKVLMMRRGGVIPNLEGVVEKGREEFKSPSKCPSCGAPTEVRDDFLYCTNKKGCMQTKMAELEHFIKTIECDGLGSKLIEQLYENQLVTDPSDFYKLTKDELMNLERMGDTLAEKLLKNISGKRELSLDVFLRSLGIRELGRHASLILAEKYRSLDKVLNVTKEELSEIHTFGEIIAANIVDGLKEKRSLIERLLKEIKIKSVKREVKEGPLADKKVLFTGSLVNMERKAAQKLVEDKGGIVATTISKEVDYLVVGSGGGAGSKLAKAEKMVKEGVGIKIISEEEFFRFFR